MVETQFNESEIDEATVGTKLGDIEKACAAVKVECENISKYHMGLSTYTTTLTIERYRKVDSDLRQTLTLCFGAESGDNKIVPTKADNQSGKSGCTPLKLLAMLCKKAWIGLRGKIDNAFRAEIGEPDQWLDNALDRIAVHTAALNRAYLDAHAVMQHQANVAQHQAETEARKRLEALTIDFKKVSQLDILHQLVGLDPAKCDQQCLPVFVRVHIPQKEPALITDEQARFLQNNGIDRDELNDLRNRAANPGCGDKTYWMYLKAQVSLNNIKTLCKSDLVKDIASGNSDEYALGRCS